VVKGKTVRHEELQRELMAELKALRQSVREAAEGFILRKEGEIETLLDYLLKMPHGRLKGVARPWLREAHDMKLKPAKGRMKDLKKIDTLLHDLLTAIVESDGAAEPANGAGKNRGSADAVKKGAAAEKKSA
jgi:hypothetical protein